MDPIGNKPFGFHGLSRLQCHIKNMFNTRIEPVGKPYREICLQTKW